MRKEQKITIQTRDGNIAVLTVVCPLTPEKLKTIADGMLNFPPQLTTNQPKETNAVQNIE